MDFDPKPINEPATAPWGLQVSSSDLSKLTAGLEAFSNDDKWRVQVTPNSDSGLTSATFFRTGGRKTRYILHLDPSTSKIDSITWEQKVLDTLVTEEIAKKEVVLVSRWQLKCDFEDLPKYDDGEKEGVFHDNKLVWEGDAQGK